MVMIHIGMVEPYPTPIENKLEVYNNYSILWLSYCLFCYTDYVPDPQARYTIGFLMIFLTGQNLIVNLYVIAQEPLHKIKLKLKRAWILRLYKINQRVKQREAEKIEREKQRILDIIKEEDDESDSNETER